MSPVKLYHHKKCSTCLKSKKFLQNKNIAFNEIDISEKPPSTKELNKMLIYYDGNIKKLFNTSGLLYRQLNLKEKLPNLSKDDAIDLLSKNGMLVKRPFLLTKNSGAVGFKTEEWGLLKYPD